LLEPGLSSFCDDAGTEVGADYETAVGNINLLAEAEDGSLVVVLVAKRDVGEDIIAQMLQRIGWVRKHLLKDRSGVRGIVLLERVDEKLGYSAAAVADSVEFRTCRIALSFEKIEF